MYSLILGGGLGNQMFQYAYARYLSLEYGIDFVFNLYEYVVSSDEIEKRSFSLENFNIINQGKFQNREEAIKEFEKFNLYMKKHKLLLKILLSKYSCQMLANNGIICSLPTVYSFNKIRLNKHSGIIHGGFQSEKFFEKYRECICDELIVTSEVSSNNKKILDSIKSSNSVAVHIRRGDYLNPKYSYLNVCDYNYYKKAVEYFLEKEENYVFFVFSNNHEEIEWIKKNYDFFPNTTVYIDENNKDYEDLQLMYNCNHFIISNSTFSWWAQYLGKNDDKIVIAPSIWNKLSKNSKDIFQKSWILIKVGE